MIIICALTVSFLWYSKAIAEENKVYWANRIDSISQNDFLVYSNPEDEYMLPPNMLAPFYRDYYLPFEETFINKVEEIDNIKGIYPIIGAPLIDRMTIGSSNDIEFSIYSGEEMVINQVINPYMHQGEDITTSFENLMGNVVFPSFSEQNLYDLCDIKTNNKDGIYICHEIAKVIGLDKINDDMKICFNIFVPSATRDDYTEVISYDKISSKETTEPIRHVIKMSVPVYEKILITIPISGILPENYMDEVLSTSKILFYLPYEKFITLLEEAKSKHILQSNEYEYEPKAYRLFFSGDVDRQKLKEKIMSIDKSAVIVDNYVNKVAQADARENNDNYLSGATNFLLVVSIVLILVYGNYHKADVIADDMFFRIRGVSRREQLLQTIIEMFVMTIIISIFSVIISNILMTYGLTNRYVLLFRNTAFSTYPVMILMNMGLAFTLSLVSELPLLFHKKNS